MKNPIVSITFYHLQNGDSTEVTVRRGHTYRKYKLFRYTFYILLLDFVVSSMSIDKTEFDSLNYIYTFCPKEPENA